MPSNVWLIGGTSESAKLASELLARDVPFIVTVTTDAARSLYPPAAQVHVGKLTPEAMADFVQQQQVGCVLDASHPFANEVSRQAIALTNTPINTPITPRTNGTVPYLRYERPTVSASPAVDSSDDNLATNNLITVVPSIEGLLASEMLCHQRVLFTLGYRYLSQFAPLRQTSQLFARILPSEDAIACTLSAGFKPQEIVAFRPPVSVALEKALWEQWNISVVVAKASGSPGGETVKRQVSALLGTHLVLIQRPPVSYPRQTSSLIEAVDFCERALRE